MTFEAKMTRRDDGSFWPSQEEDKKALSHIKARQTIRGKYSEVRERNYMFLKKYMALIDITFENLPESLEVLFKNATDLRRDITVQSGYYDVKFDVFGNEVRTAKSIAFGNMSEQVFRDLYNTSVDTIIKFYLKGAHATDMKHEVINRIASHF